MSSLSEHAKKARHRRLGGRAVNNSGCHKQNEDRPPGSLHPIRAYDPAWHDFYKGDIADIIVPCPCCKENRIKTTPYYKYKFFRSNGIKLTVDYDSSTVVVAIDSACRDNGHTNARASIGVFYGPGASNQSRLVPEYYSQTNQVAELFAAMAVLHVLKCKTKPWDAGGDEVCKVLIMTDSAYLVNGISDHIWTWKKNGYRNAKGGPVANLEMWLELHEMMLDFEANEIDVWFWHIKREFNGDPDRLANEALDRGGYRLESSSQ